MPSVTDATLKRTSSRRRLGMRVEPGRRCSTDAVALVAIDGPDAAAVRRAGAFLDLDEHEPAATAGDEVDLVGARADVRAEDAVAP